MLTGTISLIFTKLTLLHLKDGTWMRWKRKNKTAWCLLSPGYVLDTLHRCSCLILTTPTPALSPRNLSPPPIELRQLRLSTVDCFVWGPIPQPKSGRAETLGALRTQSSALFTHMQSVLGPTFMVSGLNEIPFTCRKIHLFKVYRSMAFDLLHS